MIYLFMDEDGVIWYDEQGNSREATHMAYHNGDIDAAVKEAIDEATEEGSGEYVLLDEQGRIIREGKFNR